MLRPDTGHAALHSGFAVQDIRIYGGTAFRLRSLRENKSAKE